MKARNLSVLLVVGLMFCSIEQKAQGVDVGLTVGVSTGSVKVSEIGSAVTNTINGDNILGFEGGIFARLNIDPLYVKGMLLVASRSGKSEYSSSDGTFKSSDFSVSKIELPILFGLKLIGPLRVEAGPVINWIYSESHTTDESFSIRKTGYGYRVGASVELGILNLGLAYQGLKNSSNSSSTATYASPNELIFTLGIILGSSNSDSQ